MTLKEIISFALLLCFAFFFFLMLYVSFYYFFINSYCAYKISPRPKMISPIWLLSQSAITLENFYCQFSLEKSHVLRHRQLGRYRNIRVHMICLYAQFHHFYILPFAQYFYILFNCFFYCSRQNPKTIFRNPYDMIIAFENNMCQLSVLAHADKSRNLLAKPNLHHHRHRRWVSTTD